MVETSAVPIVSNRPVDDAFHQQRLKTWQPILSPMNVIIIFLVIGVAFIPSGIGLMNMSNDIYEMIYTYDGPQTTTECMVESVGSQGQCVQKFALDKDVESDLYVYYELENFYQNHRMYVKSQSTTQLLDTFDINDKDQVAKLKTDSCENMATASDGRILWPCGLIANSFFSDSFKLDTNTQIANSPLDEENIAWASDYDKFQNPEGTIIEKNTNSGAGCREQGLPVGCGIWPRGSDPSDTLYYYSYPNHAEVKYNFETYDTINPLLGLQDEHFMIWMRTAALPKFRKIYGKIKGPFKKGDELTFNIVSTFEVRSFDGKKSLVLSTISPLGGKNEYIGTSFLVVGSVSILLTVLFIIKHLTSDRRKLGDTNLLRWDD